MITIYRIPTPASDEDVAKYSQIRLSTLQTNPEAFSSTFSDASLLTHDQWKERVNTTGRTTFIAHKTDASGRLEDEEWLGTLSVLHPEMLRNISKAFPRIPRVADAVANEEIQRYLLVGMWVHPNARKKGIGKVLVQASLDVIKEQLAASQESKAVMKTKPKMVFLEVHTVNRAARALYSKMGFVEEIECEGAEDGHTCMTISL